MSNRLEALRIFCIAAETRNFREAAARLAVSPQVVTRVVKELEDDLGEPLFHRSTRGVQLSSFGEQLVQKARDAVGGVDGLFHRSDRRTASSHAGVVRIAAPTFIGRQFVMGHLAPLAAQHPGLVIDMRLSEAIADVVDQQIDVGIRIGFMRDSRFVARPVSKVDFVVVGTPALIERVGRPASLEALFTQPTTALVDRNTGRLWPWLFKSGRQMAPSAPAFVTDHAEAECEAVLAGFGFGQLTSFFAESHIRAGRLVPLFGEEAPDPWTLYVYRSQRAPVPARVRLVYDTLIDAMSQMSASTSTG